MGLIRSLFKESGSINPFMFEQRSTPGEADDFWYNDAGFAKAPSVTAENVFGIVEVYACVNLLAKSAALCPLKLYKRKGDTRVEDTKQRLSRVLRIQPNDFMTHTEWIKWNMATKLLRGNSYNQIIRNRKGEVTQLIPIHPSRIVVFFLSSGELTYEYTRPNGQKKYFPADEILHFKELTLDGVIGISPITALRAHWEKELVRKNQSSLLFKNKSLPGGVLTHPQKLDEETSRRIRNSWQVAQSGDNLGKVAVLEDGMKFDKIGLSPQDTQFVEQERLGIESGARAFGIPPHKIADLSRSTNNNIEHQGIEYVQSGLLPHLKDMEERIMITLLDPDTDQDMYVEFNVEGLMRGDFKSRQEGLQIQRQNGIIDADQWCKMENYPPLEKGVGDKHLVNGNMISVKAISDDPKSIPAPKPDAALNDIQNKNPDAAARSFDPLVKQIWADLIERVARREEKKLENIASKPNFEELRSEFTKTQGDFFDETLRSTVRKYVEIRTKKHENFVDSDKLTDKILRFGFFEYQDQRIIKEIPDIRARSEHVAQELLDFTNEKTEGN